MEPPVALLVVLATLFAPLVASHQLLAVSQRGLLHLDSTGAVLGWRNESMPSWDRFSSSTLMPTWRLGNSAVVIPQNGTVCWFRAPSNPKGNGAHLRCALLADLSQAWDLPQARELALHNIITIAFDWVGQNWYLTAIKWRQPGGGSFVCSYLFDRCVDLTLDGDGLDYLAAYDIPNRLLFRLVNVHDNHRRLESVRLDGSGRRELPRNITKIGNPQGFAVDPIGRRVYWSEDKRGQFTLFSVDYDGTRKERVWQQKSWRQEPVVVSVAGGGTVVSWRVEQLSQIAAFGGTNTSQTAGATQTQGTVIQALEKVRDLLTIAIFSPNETASDVSSCSEGSGGGGGGCQDLCVPTVVDGTASSTCFCPEGQQLVALRCRQRHPAHAAVLGADALQIVDLQTGAVTTLLSNLTDGTRADVFWAGGEEFLLFWVDDGSLYRGQWSPAGLQPGVRVLVPATESVRVTDVAVDWNQRQLLWMTRRSGDEMVIQISQLDGAYPRTVLISPWADQHVLAVHESGSVFTYSAMERGTNGRLEERAMTANLQDLYDTLRYTPTDSYQVNNTHIITDLADIADVVVATSLTLDLYLDRTLFLDRATQSVYELPATVTGTLLDDYDARKTLLTHPSLAHAGGLDVLIDLLYWTDSSTGRLWTVDTATDGDARPLAEGTGGRALRLLHPWRQPAATQQLCGPQSAAGCSQLCIRFAFRGWGPPQAQCVCADGFRLGDDQKTCQAE